MFGVKQVFGMPNFERWNSPGGKAFKENSDIFSIRQELLIMFAILCRTREALDVCSILS